jgi:hypothetical protein
MIALALGFAALALLLGAARGFSLSPVANLKMLLAWLTILGALAAAAMLLLTGRVLAAVAVVIFAAPLAWSWWREGRAPGPARRAPVVVSDRMTRQEAADILGVPVNAGRAEVQTAWKRRMRTAHPDQGGSQAAASRVNQARDRLLSRQMNYKQP